jgi:hypothetical protein
MTNTSLGQIIYSFIEDHLKTQKGLRPSVLDDAIGEIKRIQADARRDGYLGPKDGETITHLPTPSID